MTNPFDQLSGNPFDALNGVPIYPDNLGINFKRLHKKYNPIAVHKKVTKKSLKVTKKVLKSKVGQIVVIAAASYFGTPALGKAAKLAFTAKEYADKRKANKNAIRSAKKQQQMADQYNPQAQAAVVSATEDTQTAITQMMQNPKFGKIARGMKRRGATDQQIIEKWQQSPSFKALAVPHVAAMSYPTIKQSFIDQGYSDQQADQQARVVAEQAATGAVDNIQQGTKKTPLWVWGAGALAAKLVLFA